MEWLRKVFKRKKEPPHAMVFVDYEHWYYSLQKLYHLKPNPIDWRKALEENYCLRDIIVFGNFSYKGIGEEVSKIRNITNMIIETQNTFPTYKKDMTDFIMLDYIYQYVAEHPETQDYILFTGDGHFQSVVKYLTQRLGKRVIVYGVKDAISTQLRNVATKIIELPSEDEVLKGIYPMIISNLAYVSEKIHIIPTFQGTIRTVADRNNVPEELVHAALAEMMERGFVHKKEQKMGFNRKIKVLEADWEALIASGLWSVE